jgi:hypothetical protein
LPIIPEPRLGARYRSKGHADTWLVAAFIHAASLGRRHPDGLHADHRPAKVKLSRSRKGRPVLGFSLSERASVKVTLRRKGGTSSAKVRTLTFAGKLGVNSSKIGRKIAGRGRYLLTIVASDAAGNRSAPIKRKLTIGSR